MTQTVRGKGPAPETYFAPAKRANAAALRKTADRVSAEEAILRVLDAVPGFAFVLNSERQIVAASQRTLDFLGSSKLEEILGERIGEVVNCLHVATAPNGCGTAKECALCGAGASILESQETRQTVTRECRISIGSGTFDSLDLEVVANQVKIGEDYLTVCAMRDISGEKRRRVLERVFFHDIMNTASGLRGIAYFLAESDGSDAQADTEFKAMMKSLTEVLVHEIYDQRQLLAAESGDLEMQNETLSAPDLLKDVRALLSQHEAAEEKTLVLAHHEDGSTLSTDPSLLRRVLVNMVKNALEATPKGSTVTMDCVRDNDFLVFTVHNPTVMPEEVQLQIFKRSFSTKGGAGRGIGTYSMKLLGEKYLGGQVDFTSCEPQGTTFFLRLPSSQKTP